MYGLFLYLLRNHINKFCNIRLKNVILDPNGRFPLERYKCIKQ